MEQQGPSGSDADPEGDALRAEIEADRRDAADRRKRLILFVPPLLALVVAAWALGVSRPRVVYGGRAWIGGRPPAGEKLRFRAMVVTALPGIESHEAASGLELRPFANGVRGSAERTNADGIAEITVEPPLPPSIELEAKLGLVWQPVVTIPIASLPEPDPRGGALTSIKRSGGSSAGALMIDAAAEKGALAPPLAGAVWIRVADVSGAVHGAHVTVSAEAGLSVDPAPAITDANGLARVEVRPVAPPVVLKIEASHGAERGSWNGTIGSVLGTAVPSGDGRLSKGTPAVELVASSSRKDAYVDLWQAGVRVGGGHVVFEGGRATFSLPRDAARVFDLECASSPFPPGVDDLPHAAVYPLVIENDPIDAWGAVATSPRIGTPVTKAVGGPYESAVTAALAFAPPALPKRPLVADGLPRALKIETARMQRVRRLTSFAVVGGGLLEIGLMLWLGVLGRAPNLLEENLDLLEPGELPPEPQKKASIRFVAVVVSSVGIIALVFAALATMAWGMP